MSDLRSTTTTFPVRSNSNAIEWVYDRTQYGSNEGLIMEGAVNAMPAMDAVPAANAVPAGTAGPAGTAVPAVAPSRGSEVPLRLTRRGRMAVAAVAALLVTVISLLSAGGAQAPNHALPPGAARQGLVQVVVRSGQSLWSVAESADPDQDTRAVIQQIVDLNG